MAIAAAPAIAEAAPAIAGAAEGSAAAGAASESAAGSAGARSAATKTKAPSPKPKATEASAATPSKKSSGKSEAAQSVFGSGGGKGGKKSTGKKFFSKVGNKKILLPELISCLVVLVFGTLVAPKGSKDDVHRLLVKGSALMGVFFILAIVSTGGKGPQKFANILGLLITLSYLLNSSDIHNIVNWVNSFFGKPKGGTSTPPSESENPPPIDSTEPATLPSPPSMEV